MIVNQVDNTKFGDLARYQVIFRLNYTELNEETNKFDKKDRLIELFQHNSHARGPVLRCSQ